MNALVNFTFEQESVRVIMLGDDPWWVAADIAKVLGYSEAAAMTRSLDDDEKGLHNVQTLGGDQQLTIISESGLFAAILKSRRAEAKRFRRWVTGEVLPAIRRTGSYTLFDTPPQLPSPAIEDADLGKLNAAIGIMREARQVWGREECRAIWIKIGLPAPIVEGISDQLVNRVRVLTAERESLQLGELVAALGMPPDTRSSIKLGAALRELGWQSRRERVNGALKYVWRREAGR